jgi:hypothetical protein
VAPVTPHSRLEGDTADRAFRAIPQSIRIDTDTEVETDERGHQNRHLGSAGFTGRLFVA